MIQRGHHLSTGCWKMTLLVLSLVSSISVSGVLRLFKRTVPRGAFLEGTSAYMLLFFLFGR